MPVVTYVPKSNLEAAEARIRELEEEVRYLRTYGNKDCTAMADDARARSELGKSAEPKR